MSELKNRMLACMLCGAIGDSMGMPAEFLSAEEIVKKYGIHGITGLTVDDDTGLNLVSDDTQMSMFSLEALVLDQNMDTLPDMIYKSYLRWFDTQYGPEEIPEDIASEGRLHKCESMFAMRCPGHACIKSLRSGIRGTPEHPINLSLGNGAVMRAAPFGFLVNKTPEEVYALSMKAAAFTHGTREAQECAAAFSLLIYFILKDDSSRNGWEKIIFGIGALEKWMRQHFLSDADQVPLNSGWHAIMYGQFAAARGNNFGKYISYLNDGWLAFEALSIASGLAIYTADFRQGLWMAVNRNGDSDTIASIYGNIYGAAYGLEDIDIDYSELEHEELIQELVDDFAKLHPAR